MQEYSNNRFRSNALIMLNFLVVLYEFVRQSLPMRFSVRLPPGPKPVPIFGCLLHMLASKKSSFRWIHQIMDEVNTEITCIRLGGVHVIPVWSPEIAQEFLRKHDAIFSSRPHYMSSRLTSNGFKTAIFAPLGDQWKKMKRLMVSHVLSPAKHEWLHDKRRIETEHLVKYLFDLSASGAMISIRSITRHYCGNVTRRVLFNKRFFGSGSEKGGPGREEEEHINAIFELLKHLFAFSISDFSPCLELFDFDGNRGKLQRALETINKLHDPEIDERVQMWKDGLKETEDDILDVLINLKDDNNCPLLTVEEMKAQVEEIVLAAIDNPSNAVEWAMAEMINNPHIFTRAQKELDNVVGRNRLVEESDLPKLNYVKACAREALRLHPVTPFNVPHVSIHDATVSGYFIPKGSHVILSRCNLGRNPRIWSEPQRFMPERHIHDDGSEVSLVDSQLRMLSFSTGRRGCPGVLLGTTMTTMLLATLLQGFIWSSPSVNMDENEDDLFRLEPLCAIATPRLNHQVYDQLSAFSQSGKHECYRSGA